MTTICFALGLALLVVGLLAGPLQAASWNSDTDGSWIDPLKWTGGVPDAAAAVADFSTVDITADRTVTLDTNPNFTVGSLIFGDTDPTTTAASWTIAGINTLTLDNTGGSGDPTITVNALGAGKSATISATLLGTAGFTKVGTGALTLSGANSYSGTTTLSSGTLNLNNASALGYSTLTINSGRIDNTSGAAITLSSNTQIWNGDFAFTGTNNLNLGTTTTVTLGGNRIVTVDAGTLTVGGVITGPGLTLTKAGTGELHLGGSLHAYGNTIINGGTVNSTNNQPFAAATTVTFNAGTLTLPGSSTNIYNYATVIPGGQSGTIHTRNNGYIEPASLTGSGTLTMSTVNAKTVSLQGAAWASFTGAINFVNTTTTQTNFRLRYQGPGAGHYFSGFNAASAINIGPYVTVNTATNSSGNQVITMGSLSGDATSNLTYSNGGAVVYEIGALGTDTVYNGSVISRVKLTKVGTGKLTLTGTNTYISNYVADTVSTTINNGTLQIGNGGTTGTLGSNGAQGGVLNNASLVFNRSDSLVVPNAISGIGSTTINAGTIYLNSAAVANPVNVSSGATLGGQGTVSLAATVAAGGNIEGGQAGVGVLTLGSLTYSGLGTANFMPSLATKTTAPLNVTNALTTNGAATVSVNILGLPLSVDTYTLIKYGTTMSSFGDFIIGTTPGGGGSRPKNYALANNTGNKSIDLNVTGADSNITWTGSASSSWDNTIRIPGTTNWKYTNPLTGTSTDFYLGDNVLFTDTGAKTADISVADVTPSGVTFTNTAGNDYVLSGTYGIAGGTGLQKSSGAGKVTISSLNSYTGGTTINAGTISIASDAVSGAAPLGNVPAVATPRNIVLNNGALSASATLTLNANRGVALGPTSGAGSGTIDVAEFQDLNVAGVVANNGDPVGGYGTGSLNKTGSGTLTLSGTNTFSGNTVVSGGVLTLANSFALQNSTLDYNNQGGTLSFGVLTAATIVGLNGAQNLDLGSAALTVGNLNGNSSYSGALSGGNSLVKTGTGTITLSGSNVYSGATYVNNGSMTVSGTGSLNNYNALHIGANYSSGNVTFMNNATASLSTIEFGQNLRGGGTLTMQDTADVTVSGNFDLNNEITGSTVSTNNTVNLNGGTLSLNAFSKTRGIESTPKRATLNFNGTLIKPLIGGTVLPALGDLTANVQAGGVRIDDLGTYVNIDQPLIHAAALGATPDGGLTKIGAGNLILTGANTYTGATTINDGVLELASTSQIATASAISTAATSATFQINGGTHTVGDISGIGNTNVMAGSNLTATSLVQGTLTIGAAATMTIAPIPGGPLAGTGGLTAVPEPSTWAMLILAAMGLGIYFRRSR